MNFSLKVDSLEIYFSNIHDTSHSQPGDYYYWLTYFNKIDSYHRVEPLMYLLRMQSIRRVHSFP